MKDFLTDEMIAARLRVVETRLRTVGLVDLADEVAGLAASLEPEVTT